MTKGIFITATGTDVGKTYVAGLIVKKMRESTAVTINLHSAALKK